MALDVRLYSSDGYLLELDDSTVYGIREGSGLGPLAPTRLFAEVWGRGHHPLAGYSYGNRVAPLLLKLRSASLDGWATNLQQLEQTLLGVQEFWAPKNGGAPGRNGAQLWLSVQLDGQTNALVWDVLAGDVDASALFRHLMTVTAAPTMIDVPLNLVLKPFGHPQQRTRTVSGTLTSGIDTYTLSAPAGQVDAPVKVTIQGAAGDTFRRYILGRKTGINPANFIFCMECETGTFTGYTVAAISTEGQTVLSNVVDANAHGGNKLRVTVTSGAGAAHTNVPLIRWAINDNLADFRGTYRVLLAGQASSTNLTNWSLAYAGPSGGTVVNNAVLVGATTNAGHLWDLGRMEIPYGLDADTDPISELLFTLRASYADANYTFDADCIYLMPIDEEVLDVEFSAEGSALDQVVSDNLAAVPALRLLDSAGTVQTETQSVAADSRFTIVPGRDILWCPLLLTGTSVNQVVDLTDQFTLTFEYFPLFQTVR
ncbi:MAG: hypothetical protein NTZ05_14740 [Chloroflexi bacterium]|nr:hypothetical protein [Chloroflexota bacterium]